MNLLKAVPVPLPFRGSDESVTFPHVSGRPSMGSNGQLVTNDCRFHPKDGVFTGESETTKTVRNSTPS